MSQNDEPCSDGVITERDLFIGSFIVAIGLVSFWIAYWGGRDIGSMLFN
jgi:hypothetical protein